MTDGLDGGSIAADVASDLIKSAFNSVLEGVSSVIRTQWTKVFEDFAPYAQQTHKKISSVRILCVKDRDVPFADLYVGSSFEGPNKRLSDEELITLVGEKKNIIISGDGGSGKTFFMRKLWLSIFERPAGILPIFVELRRFGDHNHVDLKSFIRATISSRGLLTSELFEYFCAKGRFCFILDGFDEVPDDIRDKMQAQILEFSAKSDSCVFVMSTRPGSRYAGWQGFTTFSPLPFDLTRVTRLISAVPFDPTSKAFFLKRLDKAFYDEHRSFLSNPLLAIMMMMTFRENMEIPKRMNIFYDQAFNTLFTWHDVTKAFSRPKAMDIDVFRKAFSIFSLLTYYEERYEFTATEMDAFLVKTSSVAQLGEVRKEDIIRDFVEAVNLMRVYGLFYVFVHRSFQEYFAAFAMVNILSDKIRNILPAVEGRSRDSVIPLAFQMNSELMVREYIVPNYKKLMVRIQAAERGAGELCMLEALGVVYEVSTNERSFGVDYDVDLAAFLDTAMRCRDGRTGSSVLGAVFGVMFDKLLAVINDLYDSDQGPSPVSDEDEELPEELEEEPAVVRVHFAGSHVHWAIVGGGDLLRAELDDAIGRQEQSIREASSPIEEAVRDLLTSVRLWCEEQIRASDQRQKSLDEILGI